jgi:hypothetical protein
MLYTYFTRNTLNEGGLGSVLFNALNMPSTLKPYLIDQHWWFYSCEGTGLGNDNKSFSSNCKYL